MKIRLLSDLHLEFSMLDVPAGTEGEILVLAGDIVVADSFTRGVNSPKKAKANEWLRWFESTCAKFEHVIYILGNHEHYNGKFYDTYDILQNNLGHISNLSILDQTFVDIENYRFVGGTLWTDFDNDNFKALIIKDALNDYHLTEGKDYRKLTTNETALYCKQMLNFIDLHYQVSKKDIIVVSHHLPSYRSVHKSYLVAPNNRYNPGYASNLDNFIADRTSKIKLWVHGHTHSSFDYFIDNTRVVSNPRGYQLPNIDYPENLNFDVNKVITL